MATHVRLGCPTWAVLKGNEPKQNFATVLNRISLPLFSNLDQPQIEKHENITDNTAVVIYADWRFHL